MSHHVPSLLFTSEFLTKLMFGFSNGDRSAKAKLVAISGASLVQNRTNYVVDNAHLFSNEQNLASLPSPVQKAKTIKNPSTLIANPTSPTSLK